jgi:hypothetical protein
MKPFAVRVLSALFFLMLMSATAESAATWFHKRVVWQARKEPRVWETKIVSPDGKEHFRLALIPLWAVEGGIVGIEILLARPEHPDDNMLGQRDTDVSQPFVVTVEELEHGINKSPCGSTRDFRLDRTTLRVEVQGLVLEKASANVGTARTFKSLRLILCWEANQEFTCPNQLAKRLLSLRPVGTKLTLVLFRFWLHRDGNFTN